MEVGKELVWHRCGIVFCLIMSLISFLRIVKRSLATTKTIACSLEHKLIGSRHIPFFTDIRLYYAVAVSHSSAFSPLESFFRLWKPLDNSANMLSSTMDLRTQRSEVYV